MGDPIPCGSAPHVARSHEGERAATPLRGECDRFSTDFPTSPLGGVSGEWLALCFGVGPMDPTRYRLLRCLITVSSAFACVTFARSAVAEPSPTPVIYPRPEESPP